MTNDETGRQIFVYACDGVKQGLKALAEHYKKLEQNFKDISHQKKQVKNSVKIEKARQKVNIPYEGKQSVKQLMMQHQQLNSIDISGDSSLRNFNKIAKNHGVDFAVKQNKETNKYLIFFKAKDTDVLASVFNEFSQKELNKKAKKESLIGKINEHEKKIKETHKQSEKVLSEKEVKNAENREL